jgi:predicted GIY-YIG superfamily endonuclease
MTTKYHVYIWKGKYIGTNPTYLKNGFYRYRGFTTNLERRIKEHRRNHKKRVINIEYIWTHQFITRQSALRFEIFLKSNEGYLWCNENIPNFKYDSYDKDKYTTEQITCINQSVENYLNVWSSLIINNNKYIKTVNGEIKIKHLIKYLINNEKTYKLIMRHLLRNQLPYRKKKTKQNIEKKIFSYI